MAQAPASGAAVTTGRATAKAGQASPGDHHVPLVRNDLARPGALVGAGWRRSGDRAVEVAGDATGLHVLAADAAHGYEWRTVATLAVRGTDTSQWIGQACLTSGGTRAVVVYAPREITNSPGALGYGALAAVVDLSTGHVTYVPGGVSISYFDPGCGAGQDAVLTQGGTGASPIPGPLTTRLMLLDTATGEITSTVTMPGQVTSAVPYRGGIAAVSGSGLVSIGVGGAERVLAKTRGPAFRLSPDAASGLGFQVASGGRVQIWRYAAGHAALLGTAPLGAVELSQVGGQVFVTGPHARALGSLPADWRAVDAPAFAQVSSTGLLAVVAATGAVSIRGHSLASAQVTGSPQAAKPVRILGWATATGKEVSFAVPPATGLPRNPPASALPGATGPPVKGSRRTGNSGAGGPARAAAGGGVSTNPATTTWDPDRACSVPRNDPTIETYQPSDEQIEWAADEAVRGDLTDTRGPDLYGSGMPAYTPQGPGGLFPLPALDGGGQVPPQVLLGVLTQESALYQASFHVIIGQAGNFEPSFNWYGDEGNYTYVNWANADCGYGIAQVTSGMCWKGRYHCKAPFSPMQQEAIAVDYQANIAAGLQILVNKWNELYQLGITPNPSHTADPSYIENWYLAVWDYNSGLEPATPAEGNTTGCSPSPKCTDSGGNWGLGWANNPANDAYPPDRPSFLEQSSAVAPDGGTYTASWEMSHPQYWPYQEKVMGWAFNAFTNWSFVQGKYVQAYQYGKWPNGATSPAIVAHAGMCTTDNHCNPADVPPNQVQDPANPCQLGGNLADHCWWHWPVDWTNCAQTCGTGVFAYPPGASEPPYPGVPPGYPPDCTKLASSVILVGDTASSLPAPLGCGSSWHPNGGVMSWQFGSATSKGTTTYPSKIDFHQISAGYGGHFWFTHTIPSAAPDKYCTKAANQSLQVTGTWTPAGLTGSATVWAALPNYGAEAPGATYQVVTGTGAVPQTVIVPQSRNQNHWVNLGTYSFSAGGHVSLTNADCFDQGGQDIAWGAMAFVPQPSPSVDYVALGDSYAGGDGVKPYYPESNTTTDQCRRSQLGYPTLIKLPGQTITIAQQAAKVGSNVQFSYIACAGAETTGITRAAVFAASPEEQKWNKDGNIDWGCVQGQCPWNKPSDRLPEGLQAEQGRLTAQTTLVTLTIGGNDARFRDILTACLFFSCNGPFYEMRRYLVKGRPKDPASLIRFEPVVIKLLRAHLVKTYQAIHAEAPNAKIIVTGYPLLFPANPTSTCTVGLKIFKLSAAKQNFLNQMGALLDGSVSIAVSAVKSTGVNIHYLDPRAAFSGHAICSSAPWLNGLLAFVIGDGGLKLVDSASFHPNQAGQAEYAKLVNGCLDGSVPC
jgi:hypothetical protein